MGSILLLVKAVGEDTDKRFVEELYNAYSEKLYMVAYQILHHHFDAEDCVQDTFMQVIDHIDMFRAADEAGRKKLLVIYCRNAAINLYHKNRRRNTVPLTVRNDDGENEELDIPDTAPSVDDQIISEENCQEVRRIIDRLKPEYRDIVILKCYGRMSYSEIARTLHVSEELARNRFVRAKRQIMKLGGEDLKSVYQ